MVGIPAQPVPTVASPELFIALGGRPGVGLIVDGLYDRLERDPALARMFRSRRAGGRDRLKEFFETIFGGERHGIRDVGTQRRHLESADQCRGVRTVARTLRGGNGPRPASARARARPSSKLLRAPAARLVNDGAPKAVLQQALVSAGNGDVDAVAALLREYPRLIDQRGGDGVTMLWAAARRGRLPLVRAHS